MMRVAVAENVGRMAKSRRAGLSMRSARRWPRIPRVGRVAQWESARFTRERSVVRNHPRP